MRNTYYLKFLGEYYHVHIGDWRGKMRCAIIATKSERIYSASLVSDGESVWVNFCNEKVRKDIFVIIYPHVGFERRALQVKDALHRNGYTRVDVLGVR